MIYSDLQDILLITMGVLDVQSVVLNCQICHHSDQMSQGSQVSIHSCYLYVKRKSTLSTHNFFVGVLSHSVK